MIIEKKPVNTIVFNNIEMGEVFKYNGNYFLKIGSIFSFDKDYNAVYISTGKIACFSIDTEVIKINSKLIVND